MSAAGKKSEGGEEAPQEIQTRHCAGGPSGARLARLASELARGKIVTKANQVAAHDPLTPRITTALCRLGQSH